MTRRYGLYGQRSRDFLTYGGRIIWHDSAAELEFLCPANVGTAVVREIPRHIPDGLMISVKDHPSFAAVTWPLTREQFRRQAA